MWTGFTVVIIMNFQVASSIFVIIIHSCCHQTVSSSFQTHSIHQHMTRDELVDCFGVESYFKVPEYDIYYPDRLKGRSRNRPSRDQTLSQSYYVSSKLLYAVRAFGMEFELELMPEKHIFSSNLLLHHWHTTNQTSFRAQKENCHYFGHVRGDITSTVAMSVCNNLMNGFVATKDVDFFIRQAPDRLESMIRDMAEESLGRGGRNGHGRSKHAHFIVRRSTTAGLCGLDDVDKEVHFKGRRIKPKSTNTDRKYIEMMLVTDSTMFDYHGNEIENYLKTVMSIAAGAFRNPSILANISLHVVRCLMLETDEVDPIIGPDSRTSLRNFCNWQESVYPEEVCDPEHVDVATLITRHDLSREDIFTGTTERGVLGLAHMASACIKTRRCSIVEDNGLATGLTVAHEIGHTLGMEHDGARNKCPVSGHIMASVTSSGSGAYKWSTCSVEYLHTFLSSPISHCLNDPPDMTKDLTLYRGWRPGQLFHRDEQCKFLYSESTGACSHRKYDCKKLWCLRLTQGNVICSTNRFPPADGTECGDGRWCIGGLCVEYGQDGPEPIHGGWSEWEPSFSDCSRTCGGGIRKKRRHCNSPTPSFGGEHCTGTDTKMETCNIFDCKVANQYLFALEQCRAWDLILYKDTFTTWEPYTDRRRITADEFCRHSCVSYERRVVVKFGKFTDGTRCDMLDQLDHDSALCVDGNCRHYGCDLAEDSTLLLDMCGACGGNNSSCNFQTGVLHVNKLNGNTTFLDIPSGSTFINITQNNEEIHFAVIIDGDYIIGGLGDRGRSKVCTDGSDTITYVSDDPESIQIRGPTKSNITLQVYGHFDSSSAFGSLPIIHWAYYEPTQEWRHHDWLVNNSACSKTCGFGITQSNVVCTEVGGSGIPVDDVNCQHLRKPTMTPRPCNEFDCPCSWEVGEWGDCSVSCGAGQRVRSAYCERENTAGMVEVIPHQMCWNEEQPQLEETCNAGPCSEENEVSCNRTIFASKGTFTSPQYPDAYPVDAECLTRITVNPGYWLGITFTTFDLEPSLDRTSCIFEYVEIIEERRNGIASTPRPRLCGELSTPFSVIVRSTVAIIRFHSDILISRNGFVAIFDELDL